MKRAFNIGVFVRWGRELKKNNKVDNFSSKWEQKENFASDVAREYL